MLDLYSQVVIFSNLPDPEDFGGICPIKVYANTARRLGGSVYLWERFHE